MTAKRFEINNDMNLDSKIETYELSCIVDTSNKTFYFIVDSIANVESFVERLNELNDENVELKNSLKEFEVFESNRIKGAVVTNDDFSVTLHSNNEAYMVCNMLNRFIRSVKMGRYEND